MALKDAVLMIVEMMEKETDNLTHSTLARYAAQLRVAVKAAEGEHGTPLLVQANADPFASIREKVADRLRVRQLEERAQQEERNSGPVMTMLHGGKSHGLLVPWPPTAPVDARQAFDDEVYRWDGSRLEYNEEGTRKYLELKAEVLANQQRLGN